MFTIDTFREGRGRTGSAEATTPENALFAAQTLFDEALALMDVQGARKTITTIIGNDGKTVASIVGKRPGD